MKKTGILYSRVWRALYRLDASHFTRDRD